MLQENDNPQKKLKGDVSSTYGTPTSDAAKVNPILAGIFKRSRESISHLPPGKVPLSYLNSTSGAEAHEIAQAAVGKGVRHNFGTYKHMTITVTDAGDPTPATYTSTTHQQQQILQRESTSVQSANMDSLTELTSNFHNSLMQSVASDDILGDTEPTPLSEMCISEPIPSSDTSYFCLGFLSKNSSLVDLAMSTPADNSISTEPLDNSENFDFTDFPSLDMFPVRSSSES
jgi:hypothetical protein